MADRGGGGPGAGSAPPAWIRPHKARPISGSAFNRVSASSARMARRTPTTLIRVRLPTRSRIVAARPTVVPSGVHSEAA